MARNLFKGDIGDILSDDDDDNDDNNKDYKNKKGKEKGKEKEKEKEVEIENEIDEDQLDKSTTSKIVSHSQRNIKNEQIEEVLETQTHDSKSIFIIYIIYNILINYKLY